MAVSHYETLKSRSKLNDSFCLTYSANRLEYH